jgi:hypothetical protein
MTDVTLFSCSGWFRLGLSVVLLAVLWLLTAWAVSLP